MTFDPNAPINPSKPKVISIVREPEPVAEPVVAPQQSHAEVRTQALARAKADNAGPYSFDYPASYFHCFVGEESSRWDFDTLASIGRVIKEPRFKLLWIEALDSHDVVPLNGKFVRTGGAYCAQSGCWVSKDGSRIPLADFREAVDARIAELGLSFVAVYAWAVAVNPCSIADERLFDSLSFDEKMKKFKTEEK